MTNPHIAPVGIGSHSICMNKLTKMANLPTNHIVHFVPTPIPIPALACTPGHPLDRFAPSPCPTPPSGILVQYAG